MVRKRFFGDKASVTGRLGRLSFYAEPEVVFFVQTPRGAHKIARLNFGSDGSIYVQFPYLETSKRGVLAELPIDPERPGPTTYNLGELGVTVDTDVKFSHHTSGLVRFSKSGLDDPTPARKSFPLTGPIGHVFQLHVYRLRGFRKLERPKKGLLHLGFEFPHETPVGLLIRGEWRRKKDIIKNIQLPWGKAGPEADLFSRVTKSKAAGYFVSPPADSPLQEHLLLIEGGPIGLPHGMDIPGMVFLGGWDEHESKIGGATSTGVRGCLAFLYPAGRDTGENPQAGRESTLA